MRDDLQKRKTNRSTSWLCSVITLPRSRKRSILQTGLGVFMSINENIQYVFSDWIFGSWEVVSPFTRKMKGHQVGQNEYVIAALVRRVVVKISNSTGSEILKFYQCFNGFGPYRRESESKWSLYILEREYHLIKSRPVGKVFKLQEISLKYLFIYGFAEKFSTSCV